MRGAIAIPILAAILLAVPAGALAQSAGDEQYVDPFAPQDAPAGQQEAPAEPAAPETDAVEPAPGGDGSAEPAQVTSPTLPRTGVPVLLFAAAGYALLLAGIAIRRQT